jgi:hypothetical protein
MIWLPNYDMTGATGPLIVDLDYLYIEECTDFTKTSKLISDETTRAVAADNTLDGRITAEVTRATNNERSLDNDRIALASSVNGRIDTEINRATLRENAINDARVSEIARVDNRITDNYTRVTNLISEVARVDRDRDANFRSLSGTISEVNQARINEINRVDGRINNVDGRLSTIETAVNNGTTGTVANYNRTTAINDARISEIGRVDARITDETNARIREVSRVDGRIDNVSSSLAAVDNTRYNEDLRLTGIINAHYDRVTSVNDARINEINRVDGRINALAGSVGGNGYGDWHIHNGIVEMWGIIVRSATTEITVGVTLPRAVEGGAVYVISLTPMVLNPGTSQDMWVQTIYNYQNPTGFTVQYQNDDTGDRNLYGFSWRIIYRGTAGAEATAPSPNQGGGGGGGGGTCPEDLTPVLMANAERTGPGEFKRADEVTPGDYVWTRHEVTMEEGAFEVTHAYTFDGILWQADNYYRATKLHPLYINNVWTPIADIGSESGEGKAVAITVRDAHTYYTQDLSGGLVLNHNIKPVDP